MNPGAWNLHSMRILRRSRPKLSLFEDHGPTKATVPGSPSIAALKCDEFHSFAAISEQTEKRTPGGGYLSGSGWAGERRACPLALDRLPHSTSLCPLEAIYSVRQRMVFFCKIRSRSLLCIPARSIVAFARNDSQVAPVGLKGDLVEATFVVHHVGRVS